MRATLSGLVGLLVVLGIAVAAFGQYGHPLKGPWSGDWGTSEDSRNRLLLQFDWDGEAITGTINPGPNAVPIDTASLDPSTWTVHVEAEGRTPGEAPCDTSLTASCRTSARIIASSPARGRKARSRAISRSPETSVVERK